MNGKRGNSLALLEGYFFNRRLTWKTARPNKLQTEKEPGSGMGATGDIVCTLLIPYNGKAVALFTAVPGAQ